LKINTFVKLIIYYVVNLFIFPKKEINKNSLLLIRLDAIGDYVMFRNFIQEIKESKKYSDYNITFIGNVAWRDVAEKLDGDYIDSFIWLDRNKFARDFVYRYRKLREITLQGYTVILSPVFSREFFYTDAIVHIVKANIKIGSVGDLSNIQKWQKIIGDKYYDKLISATPNLMFEFYRNKEFFETLLDVKLEIVKPHISLKPEKLKFKLPEKYAILFIGGSDRFRKWNMRGFAKVGEHLEEKYGYQIVLCGAPSDSVDALEFSNCFRSKYIDLVGKTSLIDLLHVIYNGNLIIANETSAPHLAISLGIENVFVISNGNHYGRFTPYPKEISRDYHVIYHPEIENDFDDYKKMCNNYGFGSRLNINEISAKSFIKKIDNEIGTRS